MAKVQNIQKALEQFEGQKGGCYFSLKNDGDVATVRFLHTDSNSLEIYIVHQVEIDGKKRWVNCPQDGHCPLCQAGNNAQLKLFLQVEDQKDGKRKLWERGKNFIPVILGFIKKYGDLSSRLYEVERHGKAGDTKTTYQLYPLDRDNVQPEFGVSLDGTLILNLSIDEMKDIVQNGGIKQEEQYTPRNPSRSGTSIF